jgi:hypothetical protein
MRHAEGSANFLLVANTATAQEQKSLLLQNTATAQDELQTTQNRQPHLKWIVAGAASLAHLAALAGSTRAQLTPFHACLLPTPSMHQE